VWLAAAAYACAAAVAAACLRAVWRRRAFDFAAAALAALEPSQLCEFLYAEANQFHHTSTDDSGRFLPGELTAPLLRRAVHFNGHA
jgi:hypothetical protein